MYFKHKSRVGMQISDMHSFIHNAFVTQIFPNNKKIWEKYVEVQSRH